MSSSFFVLAENVDSKSIDEETIEIRLAIYTNIKEVEKFFKENSMTGIFYRTLNNYTWQVGEKKYCFKIGLVSDKELLNGELTTENYDVMFYPPCEADFNFYKTGFYRLPKNQLRVKRIKDFVEDGGGYFGTCGGAAIACSTQRDIKLITEKLSSFSVLIENSIYS